MAKLATLVDNFDDNSTNATLWDVTYPSANYSAGTIVAETNQRLQIALQASIAGSHYNGYLSKVAYDFTGSEVYAKIAQLPLANAACEALLEVQVDANNLVSCLISNGYMYPRIRVGGGNNTDTAVAITAGSWVKLSEASGTVRWWTAPSTAQNPPAAGEWTERASYPPGLNFAAVKVFIGAGTNSSIASPGTVAWDSLNYTAAATVPATAHPTGTAAAFSSGTVVPKGKGRGRPSGVAMTSALGAVTAKGKGRGLPSGVAATFAVGTIVARGSTDHPGVARPQGVQATFAVGNAIAHGASFDPSRTFYLDEEVLLEAGKLYTIRIRCEDGESITMDLAPVGTTGYYTEVSTYSNIPAIANVEGNLFMLGELDRESVELIVHSIEPSENMTANINLVDYSPAVYDSDTSVIPAFDSQITLPPGPIQYLIEQVPLVTGIVSDETVSMFLAPGKMAARMIVAFQNTVEIPARITTVEGQLDFAEDTTVDWQFTTTAKVTDGALIFDGVQEDYLYKVRMRYLAEDGHVGPWSVPVAHNVIGKSSKPPTVSGFAVQVKADMTRSFTFTDTNQPLDVLYGGGYKIKYRLSTLTTAWESMTELHSGLITQSPYETNNPPAGTYDFAMVAVDSEGNEAALASVIEDVVIGTEPTRLVYAADIMPGQVQSTHIVAGAATEIITASTANTEIASNTSVNVCTVTFTPDVDCTIVISADVNYTLTDVTTGAPTTLAYTPFNYAILSPDLFNMWEAYFKPDFLNMPANSTRVGGGHVEKMMTGLVAGRLYTINLNAYGHYDKTGNGGSTTIKWMLNSAILKVEIIKR